MRNRKKISPPKVVPVTDQITSSNLEQVVRPTIIVKASKKLVHHLRKIPCRRVAVKEVQLSSNLSGLSMDIVRALKLYDKSLPIDFLAHLFHRTRFEIREEAKALERRGAIRLEDETVSLS